MNKSLEYPEHVFFKFFNIFKEIFDKTFSSRVLSQSFNKCSWTMDIFEGVYTPDLADLQKLIVAF